MPYLALPVKGPSSCPPFMEVLEFYASEGKNKVNVGRTKKVKFVKPQG
jgi:hypothetical protein